MSVSLFPAENEKDQLGLSPLRKHDASKAKKAFLGMEHIVFRV